MKKIAVLLFLSITSLSINAQESTTPEVAPDAPIFKFENEVLDYGKISKGSNGERVFKFKNIGKSPLIIENVKGSCGCTVPTKPEEPILPGESGEIKVKYDTDRIGGFTKTVTITSNASEPTKRVKIKGYVSAPESELENPKPVVAQ